MMWFFFKLYGDHRDLHSFPPRRPSNLIAAGGTDAWIGVQARMSVDPIQPTTRPIETPMAVSVTASTRNCQRRSEEHTSELQSRQYLVCRLLLEKTVCSLSL